MAATGSFRTERFSIRAEHQWLHGTIRVPLRPGRHPAMVFVSGSGNGSREEFTPQAEFLARAGVVTLAYDKREIGYDFRSRDFGLLADDVLRMVGHLRARPDVDPARTGVWGSARAAGWCRSPRPRARPSASSCWSPPRTSRRCARSRGR
ncbi:alpha/beta hydrolase family protein [Nonomuraea recticatena]|uniref:alpha/beta hydrolase family protein n=1 Tax=Nonomuraea recticatena TaxID=46178 RepID=UPI0036220989